MNISNTKSTSTAELILLILKDMEQKKLIQEAAIKIKDNYEDYKDTNLFWLARQQVCILLEDRYGIIIKKDTVYRHFWLLHHLKKLRYIRLGVRDCFILDIKKKITEKVNNLIFQKKEIDLTFTKVHKDIFNKLSKNNCLNPETEFKNFINHFHSLHNPFLFIKESILIKKWSKWCIDIHPLKITVDKSELILDSLLIHSIAEKYLNKEIIYIEFKKFKNHYISNGTTKVVWTPVWENWCINYKYFKPKAPKEQSSKQKEKADYKWDFKKAKDISDKLKDWLEFDAKINWMEEYYWKNIYQFDIKTNDGFLKLAWIKMPHPDFNKDEIILFKIDTHTGKYLLYDNDNLEKTKDNHEY